MSEYCLLSNCRYSSVSLAGTPSISVCARCFAGRRLIRNWLLIRGWVRWQTGGTGLRFARPLLPVPGLLRRAGQCADGRVWACQWCGKTFTLHMFQNGPTLTPESAHEAVILAVVGAVWGTNCYALTQRQYATEPCSCIVKVKCVPWTWPDRNFVWSKLTPPLLTFGKHIFIVLYQSLGIFIN